MNHDPSIIDDLGREESPPPLMHRLAYDSDWNGVLERLTSNVQEGLQTVNNTTWMDGGGDLTSDETIIESQMLAPIHILCTRQVPVTVLQAYLAAQPEACNLETSDGRRALHLACYSLQSPEVVRCLAEADPDALSCLESFDGWNVFHICAYLGAQEEVMSTLLQIAGPIVTSVALRTQDKLGRTPLELACILRSKISSTDFALLYQHSPADCLRRPILEELDRHGHGADSWKRATAWPPSAVSHHRPSFFAHPSRRLPSFRPHLLRPADSLALYLTMSKVLAVLGATDENLTTHPLLHECIRQDPELRTSFLEFFLRHNPYYVCQVDSNGDLPLHVAARCASIEHQQWEYWLRRLLRMYPRGASVVNRDRELVLEILHNRNMPWRMIGPTLDQCPTALIRLRLPEAMYANVLAKVGLASTPNTMFVILRESHMLFAS